MVNKSWTDQEIIEVIQSKAPFHVTQAAWDVLIGKYQDELESEALRLWGYDDFLVSDTIDQALITAKTWIQAYEDIGDFEGDFRQWLCSILYQQFLTESESELAVSTDHFAFYNYWDDQEFSLFT